MGGFNDEVRMTNDEWRRGCWILDARCWMLDARCRMVGGSMSLNLREFADGSVDLFEVFDAVELGGDFGGVSHEEHGDLFALARAAEQVDDLLLVGGVDVGGGFVGEQQHGFVG